MACTVANDSVVTETEPLHTNQEIPLSTKPNTDDTEQVDVSLLIENHTSGNDNRNNAIDQTFRKTMENPYKETTITMPQASKKVPEDDLTPKPWKTFNQILLLSYVSVFFCLCFGVFANREAWKAKLYNGKGLYGVAQKRAKRAVIISYVAICCGFLMILFIPLAASNAI